MKPKSLLSIFLLLFLYGGLHAKVLRVNNQETVSIPEQNSFITVLQAVTAAVNGDTIYLEPTPVAHGNLEIGKKLVFIGGGFFHDVNGGLTSQPYTSLVTGNWTFKLGSSGSKIIGISFDANDRGIYLEVNDIEISNCFFRNNRTYGSAPSSINVSVPNLENIIITGCYFPGGGNNNQIFGGGRALINMLFINNISLRRVNIANNSSGIISNNLISVADFTVGANSNFQIHNNIFMEMSTISLPAAIGNNLSHNIANNALFGTANNNQANVPPAEIFVDFNDTSLDRKYTIKDGGPADGKGRDGVDIGPFGGAKPYKLSGLPDIPVIYQLSTGGVANSAGKLPITIKVKAN